MGGLVAGRVSVQTVVYRVSTPTPESGLQLKSTTENGFPPGCSASAASVAQDTFASGKNLEPIVHILVNPDWLMSVQFTLCCP